MSRERPNELEERRVIRLLSGAADAVPALHDVEVETLVRLAAAPPGARRARRRFPLPRASLLAAAAAAVVALVLPLGPRESDPPQSSSGVAAATVSFPEGSALALLLTPPSERRA